MPKNITKNERIKIEALRDKGIGILEIASYLGRHRSSVSRELKKGQINGRYSAARAEEINRSNMAREIYKGPSEYVIGIIEEKILNYQWSPEQISGWLKLEMDTSVSHTWIYTYIRKDQAEGGELANNLRRGVGKYQPKEKEYKGRIPNRVSIAERPVEIAERTRLGDMEIDLIVGPKNRGAILTAVDRLSRLCYIKKLDCKSAEEVEQKAIELLSKYEDIKSITSDNGNEFFNHESIQENLSVKYYFANPYASYERGSIENLNGLVRQYIPKGTHFDEITDEFILEIQNKLNDRPRKTLKFLTPNKFHVIMKSQKLTM